MRRHLTSKRSLVLGGVLAVVVTAVAVAFWTTGGSGNATGSSATANANAVTIEQVGTITGLVPGGTAQNIDYKVTNSNPGKVSVPQVVVAFRATDPVTLADGTTPSTCATSNFALTQPEAAPGVIDENSNSTFSANGSTLALKNLSNDQDACKNVKVHLTFTAGTGSA